MSLIAFVPGQIWLKEYPVHYFGMDFFSRMTIVRLTDGSVLLHSPGHIDEQVRNSIDRVGRVRYIVAPGTYHYFHVASAQKSYPDAETYICPGIERKRPEIAFDWILGDRPPTVWEPELSQVLIRGAKYIWEVAFLHKRSKTLIVVDLLENIGDRTHDVGWQMKIWWKFVFRMWNRPKPAPEYQLGWRDKGAAGRSLETIIQWDFDKIVLAHGNLIESNAKAVARTAWAALLKARA